MFFIIFGSPRQIRTATIGFGDRHATVNIKGEYWSNGLDLNQRLSGFAVLRIGPLCHRCITLGAPNRIRTGVPTVKGSCPRPLDDGSILLGGELGIRTPDELLRPMPA